MKKLAVALLLMTSPAVAETVRMDVTTVAASSDCLNGVEGCFFNKGIASLDDAVLEPEVPDAPVPLMARWTTKEPSITFNLNVPKNVKKATAVNYSVYADSRLVQLETGEDVKTSTVLLCLGDTASFGPDAKVCASEPMTGDGWYNIGFSGRNLNQAAVDKLKLTISGQHSEGRPVVLRVKAAYATLTYEKK